MVPNHQPVGVLSIIYTQESMVLLKVSHLEAPLDHVGSLVMPHLGIVASEEQFTV